MKRWTQHKAFHAGLHTAVRVTLTADDDPHPLEEQITTWLSKLRVLQGVPFYYLVADQRMLPQESIRFFQLDENWVSALIDGAFSIGRVVTGDTKKDQQFFAAMKRNIAIKASLHRSNKLGLNAAPADVTGDVSGFLLRSAVVSGWPQIEVKATDADGNPATLLRMERISADIMICIFDKLVATVRFSEPAETLHFGIEQGTGKPQKLLKYVEKGPNDQPPGSVIDGVYADVPMRNAVSGNQVLDIEGLAGSIHQLLINNNGIASGAAYTPAEFALEMIQGVQEVDYTIANPTI